MALTLSEFETGPFNAGVNISMLPEDINPDEAVVIQDMFVDRPGQIYTRGGIRNVVQTAATFASTGLLVKGIFSTVDPSGVSRMGVITHNNSTATLNFHVLADDGGSSRFTMTLSTAWLNASDTTVDAKPALGGGIWIGSQQSLTSSPFAVATQSLIHWRGGINTIYSTGTMTSTVNSVSVTGVGTTWLTKASPGMFLLANWPSGFPTALIGVIKTVNSDTSITLEAPANFTIVGGQYSVSPIRPFSLEISRGRITTTSGSTAVIGSGTKFLSTPFDNTWSIFRSRDNLLIGTVASAQGEEGLTLAAGATAAMDNEPYTARRLNSGLGLAITGTAYTVVDNTPQSVPGILNATYAGLQWFARNDNPTHIGTGELYSRLWFSDYRNMNSVDLLTQDGDFIQVQSTVGQNLPIRGIAPSSNALLVFKENETFAVTGDDPDTFSLQKIWDDGCLSPSSIVMYKGAVIWCGRRGIYIYDGAKVTNLVARSLGSKYINTMAYFNPTIHKICAAEYNDHYFVSISSNQLPPSGIYPETYNVMKNGVIDNSSTGVGFRNFAIYLPSQALTFLTSPFNIIGATRSNTTTYYVIQSGLTGYVCDFSTVFNPNSLLDFDLNSSSTPDPYFESKRYNMGDPLRLKQMKFALITYATGSTAFPIKIETAKGLKESSVASTWTLLSTVLPNTGAGTIITATQLVKFLVRDRQIGIKFYQTYPGLGNSGSFFLRRFALGYRWMKVGRV